MSLFSLFWRAATYSTTAVVKLGKRNRSTYVHRYIRGVVAGNSGETRARHGMNVHTYAYALHDFILAVHQIRRKIIFADYLLTGWGETWWWSWCNLSVFCLSCLRACMAAPLANTQKSMCAELRAPSLLSPPPRTGSSIKTKQNKTSLPHMILHSLHVCICGT